MSIITKSPSETELIGKKLANKLNSGDILLLSGDLGAGKTSLVKGIARGLGIENEITSPTFTLMNIYKINNSAAFQRTLRGVISPNQKIKNFVHIDTYRLKNEKELMEIGVADYLGQPNTICAIEWPEKITSLLKKKKTISISLEHTQNPQQRKVYIS
mgnify:CR=1 FL=1